MDWEKADQAVKRVSHVMINAGFTAPELLEQRRAEMISALIRVADALGVKLVPDFSGIVARQDGVPLETEALPVTVVIVTQQSRAALREELSTLEVLLTDAYTDERCTALQSAINRVEALLSVTDEDAHHIYTRFAHAARTSSKHKHAYSAAAALFRRVL